MQFVDSEGDNENIKMKWLMDRLETRYFTTFLPLVYSKNYAKQCLGRNSDYFRLWESNHGKVVISLQPPPTIKENPTAKPERLGRVIKRLAWCYNQPLSGKISIAKMVLRTLLRATDRVAVAFSGGRDSLVAMHLAREMKPNISVVLVNTGIEFPESLAYVRQLAQDWDLDYHEASARVNFWKLSEEQGIPVAGRGNTTFMRDLSEKAGVKLSNSCCHRMKETPARQFYTKHGIEGVVTGLRVSESLMRKMNFADYGALRYSRTYKTLISWPLYAWKDEDIANYIEKNNLPLNPIYDMGYQRVGCWPCMQDMFYKDSRLFTLQKEHPKMYKTLRKKFGKQMMDLLKVWAGLEERNLTEKHLDGLYRACEFERLDEYRKRNAGEKRRQKKE